MYSVQPLSLAAQDAIEDLPTEFTSALSIPQHQQVLDAFSQLDLISRGSQRPKLFQLRCLISLLSARHVVLWAATGSGKTLAMILPLLLSPNKIAITVTCLKLLQWDHVRWRYSVTTSSSSMVFLPLPLITIHHMTKSEMKLLRWASPAAGHEDHCGPLALHVYKTMGLPQHWLSNLSAVCHVSHPLWTFKPNIHLVTPRLGRT
jgi:hypothetical protein